MKLFEKEIKKFNPLKGPDGKLLAFLPYEKYAQMLSEGTVELSDYNRGSLGTDTSHCLKLASTFNPRSCTPIILTIKENGVGEVVCGNHRSAAIKMIYAENSPFQRPSNDDQLEVCIIPKENVLDAYRGDGRSRPHNTIMKITNPNFKYGRFLNKIQDEVGWNSTIEKHKIGILNAAHALESKGNQFTLHEMFKGQREWTKNMDLDYDGNPFSTETVTKVIKAVSYLRQFYKALYVVYPPASSKSSPTELKRRVVETSSGIFNLLIFDLVSSRGGRVLTNISAEELAKKILYSYAKWKKHVGPLGKRSNPNGEVTKALSEFSKALDVSHLALLGKCDIP